MTDPTQPGLDADRIAELAEQVRVPGWDEADGNRPLRIIARSVAWEIAGIEYHDGNSFVNNCTGIIEKTLERLSRLRNEQSTRRTRAEIGADIDAWHRDIGRFNNASPEERKRYGALRRELAAAPLPEAPSPAPSPEPQDVRGTESSAWAALWISDAARGHSYEALQVGFNAGWQAALTQSDAQPVGWRWRYKTPEGWSQWNLTEVRPGTDHNPFAYEVHPLYTVPHRPDVSGLIEAAEWHEQQAQQNLDNARDSNGAFIHSRMDNAKHHKASAKALRSRAADRGAT